MELKSTVMDCLYDVFHAEQYSLYRNVAAVVGGLYLAKVVLRELYKLGGGFCAYFLAPLGISQTNISKYGKWAVVTGASEGIGRGYALELARRGLDVVIMSRSREKLDKVAEEIRAKYSEREVCVIPVDFSKGGEIYPDIAEELKDLDIGVLVNNVGMSSECPEYFGNIPPERLQSIVEVNVQSMVQMTRIVLPGMEARKRGVIVNLSSSAYKLLLPLTILYCATKVFVVAFSDGLRKEYGDKGICVQAVTPLVVLSALSAATVEQKKLSFFVPGPDKYARAAVSTIGIQKTTYGYWRHGLQGYILGLLPPFVVDGIFRKVLLQARQSHLDKKVKED